MSVIWHPHDAAEAVRLKEQYGAESQFISGGTWLSVQWENGAARPGHLIDVGGIPAMKGIAVRTGELMLGAATPLSAIRKEPLIGRSAPLLQEAAGNIAAPSVRNLGTLGGNVASRTGDLLPALLACDAELIWHDGHRVIAEPIGEWLSRIRGGTPPTARLLLQIKLPFEEAASGHDDASAGRIVEGYRKVGRREAFTPSVVTVSYRASVAQDGVIRSIRLAAGGGSMIPQRLAASEETLTGQTMSPQLMERLYERVLQEVQPGHDAFVSREYRKFTTAAVMSVGLWQAWRAAETA